MSAFAGIRKPPSTYWIEPRFTEMCSRSIKRIEFVLLSLQVSRDKAAEVVQLGLGEGGGPARVDAVVVRGILYTLPDGVGAMLSCARSPAKPSQELVHGHRVRT